MALPELIFDNYDEIAEELHRLHGADFWAWYHMSKRLQKNKRYVKK